MPIQNKKTIAWAKYTQLTNKTVINGIKYNKLSTAMILQEIEKVKDEYRVPKSEQLKGFSRKLTDKQSVAKLAGQICKLDKPCIIILTDKTTGQETEFEIDGRTSKGRVYANIFLSAGQDSFGSDLGEYTVRVYLPTDQEKWDISLPQQKVFKHGTDNCLTAPILKFCKDRRDGHVGVEIKIKTRKDGTTYQKEGKTATYQKWNTMVNHMTKFQQQVGQNGVNEEIIQAICDKLKCSIQINDVINNTVMYKRQTNGAKSRKEFKFYNTKFEHVDEYFCEKNEIMMNGEEMTKLKDDLISKGSSFCFNKSIGYISNIMVCGQVYKHEKIAEMKKIMSDFNEQHDQILMCRYSIEQFDFMQTQLTSNCKIQVNKRKHRKIYEYDQNQAFAQFKQTGEYYIGFSFPTQWRKVPADVQFAIKNLGNYECTLNLTNATPVCKLIYKNDNETIGLTSADINYLQKNGAQIIPLFGCYGEKRVDFDFPQNMCDKFKIDEYTTKRPFTLWTGTQEIVEQQSEIRIFCTQPELLSKSSHLESETFYEQNNIQQVNDNEYRCITKKQKKSVNSRIHISTFIKAYQRINLCLQLELMDLKLVHRIHTDGIYTHEKDAKLTSTYRFDDKVPRIECVAQDHFLHQDKDRFDTTLVPDFKQTVQYQLCSGMGGSGKTHQNIIDHGLISVIYCAPSNKLMCEKRQEYAEQLPYKKRNQDTVFQQHKYTNYAVLCGTENEYKDDEGIINIERHMHCFKWYPRNIILDEISMISKQTIEHVAKWYPLCNIIACGDPKQLEHIQESPKYEQDEFGNIYPQLKHEDTISFSFPFQAVKEYNYSYRCKDEVLRTELDKVRNQPNLKIKDLKFEIIVLEDMFNKEMYKSEDIIITATNQLKDQINKQLIADEFKYKVTRKHKFEGKQYYNGDVFTTTTQITDKKRPLDETHCFTCHSVQGQTCLNKIFIVLRNCQWANGYLYTAVSRAQYMDQIVLVV